MLVHNFQDSIIILIRFKIWFSVDTICFLFRCVQSQYLFAMSNNIKKSVASLDLVPLEDGRSI